MQTRDTLPPVNTSGAGGTQPTMQEGGAGNALNGGRGKHAGVSLSRVWISRFQVQDSRENKRALFKLKKKKKSYWVSNQGSLLYWANVITTIPVKLAFGPMSLPQEKNRGFPDAPGSVISKLPFLSRNCHSGGIFLALVLLVNWNQQPNFIILAIKVFTHELNFFANARQENLN